jgi:hypothetical protein
MLDAVQGRRNATVPISPRVTAANSGSWQIRRKPVLSGLINEYERVA